MKKEIKKHEQEYIHIRKPNIKKLRNFLLGLILLTLSFFSIKLIIYKWKDLGLDVLFNCEENCSQFASLIQLDICFNLIFTAGLIFISIMFLFSLWDKMDWDALIDALIVLFIGALIVLFIGALIGTLIVALIWTLIGTLIVALIVALIWTLIVAFIAGLE